MKRALVLCGALAAMAMAGCRSVDTVYVGGTAGGPPYRWVQTDNNLKQFAKVVSARRDHQNGLLRVQVDLKNTRNREERIVYRFVWLDAQGIEIPSIQNDWLPRSIGSGEQVQLVGIAPDTRVTDAIVKIQQSIR